MIGDTETPLPQVVATQRDYSPGELQVVRHATKFPGDAFLMSYCAVTFTLGNKLKKNSIELDFYAV